MVANTEDKISHDGPSIRIRWALITFFSAGHSNSVYPEEILQIVTHHLGGGGGGVGRQSKSIILSTGQSNLCSFCLIGRTIPSVWTVTPLLFSLSPATKKCI